MTSHHPVRITFKGMTSSPALEANIRHRVEELAEFHPRVVDVHVVVEQRHHHHHQGGLFHVAVDVSIPGEDVVVSREAQDEHAHEDPYVAVRDAFDAVVRRLEDRVRRMRGDVKTHDPSVKRGRVKHISPPEDYGFVRTEDGVDVYFHRNSVVEGDFDAIDIGDELRFTMHASDGAQGPHASGVYVHASKRGARPLTGL